MSNTWYKNNKICNGKIILYLIFKANRCLKLLFLLLNLFYCKLRICVSDSHKLGQVGWDIIFPLNFCLILARRCNLYPYWMVTQDIVRRMSDNMLTLEKWDGELYLFIVLFQPLNRGYKCFNFLWLYFKL